MSAQTSPKILIVLTLVLLVVSLMVFNTGKKDVSTPALSAGQPLTEQSVTKADNPHHSNIKIDPSNDPLAPRPKQASASSVKIKTRTNPPKAYPAPQAGVLLQ